MKVVRAWYGLKISGASWNAMLSQTMKDTTFISAKFRSCDNPDYFPAWCVQIGVTDIRGLHVKFVQSCE